MHYRLKSLSLATATLLLSLTSPLLPLTLKFEPLVAQAQTSQDRNAKAQRLNQEGLQLLNRSQFQEALDKFQQALVIFREIGDRDGEVTSLANLGSVYFQLKQHQKAIEFYQQGLAISKEIGDRRRVAAFLYGLGLLYNSIAQNLKAIEFFEQVLAISKEIGERRLVAESLITLGLLYNPIDQHQKAIEYFEQALAISKEIGERNLVAASLTYLSISYVELGQYQKGIELAQQALAIAKEIDNRTLIEQSFYALGWAYNFLGEYQKAIEHYQQNLAFARKTGNRSFEGQSLTSIGWAYYSSGEYQKALDLHQQSLAIAREIGDRILETTSLNHLGFAANALGRYQQAIEFHQQALTVGGMLGSREVEAYSFNDLGKAYASLDEDRKAIEFYQKALATAREIGNREVEATALSDIGTVLAKLSQPELAIVFYKQSVNVTEGVRQDIRKLSRESQIAYVQKVSDTYRRLADLLLKQDRVLEAQRVLDLLKVQELDDYLHNVRGNNKTAQGLPNLPPEQQTWTSYQAILNKAVEIGKELTQLRQLKQQNGTLTPAQEQRIAQLVKAQETIREEFNNFTRSPEVLALVKQQSPEALSQDLLLQMGNFNALQDNLKNLQQKAVLLYPLILDDRIELILTTPDSPPIRRTVQVPKKQLNETIAAFRSALLDRTSDAKTPAQQLYNWLIKPLEADLKAADAQTLIYAPDGQLRYIPLAALYDGQQWLVQRYRINNITAASLTDLNTKPQRQLQVLAGAFATGRYSFTVGGESFDFSGLPFAGVEVENLAKTVPATTQFIDKAFTPQVTVPKMDDYTVVHLATHAAFVVGTPDDSFILFGNGDRITLRDIQTWSLKNVDLVVLSACETGLGGKLGNGEEILGLGYQMQRAGARAAIASLWTVDDGGTQALMNTFYANLKKGNTTKVEALRQAQIALITGDSTALGKDRGLGVEQGDRTNVPPQVANRLSHPYYWAPFILIGNGL